MGALSLSGKDERGEGSNVRENAHACMSLFIGGRIQSSVSQRGKEAGWNTRRRGEKKQIPFIYSSCRLLCFLLPPPAGPLCLFSVVSESFPLLSIKSRPRLFALFSPLSFSFLLSIPPLFSLHFPLRFIASPSPVWKEGSTSKQTCMGGWVQLLHRQADEASGAVFVVRALTSFVPCCRRVTAPSFCPVVREISSFCPPRRKTERIHLFLWIIHV